MNAAAAPAGWVRLLDGLPQPAWLVALVDQRVVAVNVPATRHFQLPQEALLGRDATSLAAAPEDLAWWQAAAAGDTQALHSDAVFETPTGQLMHVTRSIQTVAAHGSEPSHALVVCVDRSAAQRADDRREALLCDLQATLEATADGILVTDPDGSLRAFNRRFAELWALPMDILERRDDAAVQALMRRSVCDVAAYEQGLQVLVQGELQGDMDMAADRLQLHSGLVLERISRPLFRAGRVQGRVWSFRDLSAPLAAQERIRTLTRCDALTGLPNRSTLAEVVQQALGASAVTGTGQSLLVVGLDRFRHINDSLGRAAGDQVLLEVAQRIRRCLREDDVLARLGGDQFAVLVRAGDSAAAQGTARRILKTVAQTCAVEGHHFTLTCSIGIALAPAHGTCLDELVQHAEDAMRSVKTSGRAGYRIHQRRTEVDRRAQMKLDHAMRQALVSHRFRLHYQPQINLKSGRVVAAEALLRWRDPELGELAPAHFIPVAEETGFIVALGDWVLSQAVRQAVLWHQRGHSMPIAVNVSALQFQQPHFVERLGHVLAVSGLPPQLLELELTESILVHDADEALLRLGALASLGLRLAIDDFGTGYSSLSYLKRFPIGKLKIDRSFVQGLPTDERDTGIVRAMLQMARALRMKVVAEGVETEAQRRFLREAGCDEFQGFLFAPALDAMSFEARVFELSAPTAPPTAVASIKRPGLQLVHP